MKFVNQRAQGVCTVVDPLSRDLSLHPLQDRDHVVDDAGGKQLVPDRITVFGAQDLKCSNVSVIENTISSVDIGRPRVWVGRQIRQSLGEFIVHGRKRATIILIS